MNQFTTISALFDQLMSEHTLESLLHKHGYEDVSRKFSVQDLIDFLMAAVLEQWDGYRDGTDQMSSVHLPSVHYSKLETKEAPCLVHDGPAGVSLADPSFILVEDRTYGKHKQLDAHEENQQRFVIRLKDNIEFHLPYALRRLAPEETNVTGDITCQLGTKQSWTKTGSGWCPSQTMMGTSYTW